MSNYPIPLSLEFNSQDTANIICSYLEKNHQDSILKTILNIDLSFIDYRAQSSNYFIINDVEYIGDNNYILYYKINYYIYNLCKDMDIDDDYETSINFTLNNGLLVFDIIDCERNISDEI
ncbi:hypothetical protein IGU62_002101 [Escherichia coli]|uniref:hypothetical protein n=1 Tax=Enterobacteriaceae TaxID=543 RepID=UPI000DA4A16E|nr:hypothetical protein [Escherichia coli]HCM9486610.1 hypothetical protein [Enterobacter kobei]EFL9656597.1 hypothetical protein [Escherichia coli]EGL8705595.1 hypothetical protein [Escherichia coli]NJU85805.1 hypothetical protein [Escherichia coli]RCA68195.1 hypothetical protein C6A39_00425 [Escherichia coli]